MSYGDELLSHVQGIWVVVGSELGKLFLNTLYLTGAWAVSGSTTIVFPIFRYQKEPCLLVINCIIALSFLTQRQKRKNNYIIAFLCIHVKRYDIKGDHDFLKYTLNKCSDGMT